MPLVCTLKVVSIQREKNEAFVAFVNASLGLDLVSRTSIVFLFVTIAIVVRY
jgi:hypothetical protein